MIIIIAGAHVAKYFFLSPINVNTVNFINEIAVRS